jgi:hypothetical protein
MNTEEIAQKVVELVRKQAWHEAVDTLYDKNIVSIEARANDGESPEKSGIDQVREKTDGWLQNMQIHSSTRMDRSLHTTALSCSTMPT